MSDVKKLDSIPPEVREQINLGFSRANAQWQRYRNDPVFHALVCSMVPSLDKRHVTVEDIRDAAEMAESIVATRRIMDGDYSDLEAPNPSPRMADEKP